MKTQMWLIWDGECDVCRRAAEWFERQDPGGEVTIFPYQEAPAPPMTPALQIQARHAVQLVTSDGDRRSGAEAILFALHRAGWHPAVMRLLLHRPLLWCAEVVYRVVAGNRHHIGRLIAR